MVMLMKKLYVKLMATAALLCGAATVSAQTWTANPANNAKVKTLSEVTISFPDATTVSCSKKPGLCVSDYSEWYSGDIKWESNGNAVTFTIDPPLTTTRAKTYSFTFEPGAFDADGSTFTGFIMLNYTVDPNVQDVEEKNPFEYVVAPTGKDELETLDQVVFLFSNATTMELVGENTVIRDAKEETYSVSTAVDGQQFYIVPNTPITTGGEYTVVIPAGTLKINGKTQTEEITKTYTVTTKAKPVEADVYPAVGKVVELNVVEVTFKDATSVAYVATAEAQAAKLLDADGNVLHAYTDAKDVETKSDCMTFPMNVAGQLSGKVTLVIPGAAYTVDGQAGIDLSYEYEIVEVIPVITPAEATVTELTGVEFAFPGFTEVIITVPAWITVKNVTKNENVEAAVSYEENVVKVEIAKPEELVAGCTYAFMLPPYSLNLDGLTYNRGIQHNVTYAPVAPDFTVEANPASGSVVTELKDFTVTFGTPEGSATAVVAAIVDEFTEAETPNLTVDNAVEHYATDVKMTDNVLTFSFAEAVTEQGEYTMTVPGSLYTLNGVHGSDLVFTYTVKEDESRIDEVNAATAPTIYTITGVKVCKAVKGINIINGKKVIVK